MRIFINIFQCIYITYMILTLHFQQTMDVFALWWTLVTVSHTTVYSVFTLRLWLSFRSSILIVRLYLCVSLCGHVHKCTGAWGGHRCPPLELGWQAVAWHLTGVLGTKLWPRGKPCELLAAEPSLQLWCQDWSQTFWWSTLILGHDLVYISTVWIVHTLLLY